MTTEQLAVLVSGLAVVASSTVAVWSARISARVSNETAEATLAHQRAQAHEARLWDRVAQAYVDMLMMVSQFMVTVDETFPDIGDGGHGDPPPPPETSETMPLMARVAAFGSPQTYSALEAWWKTRLDFDHAVWELDGVRSRPSGQDARELFGLTQAEHYQKLHDARQTCHAAVRRLQNQINAELRMASAAKADHGGAEQATSV
jgi:hypothetical protein